MREVVYVFRRTGKMHKFGNGRQLRQCCGMPLYKIFNGLDVVIGGGLNLLDFFRVSQRKSVDQRRQMGPGVVRKRGDFGNCRMFRQPQQPLYFHQYAKSNEAELLNMAL